MAFLHQWIPLLAVIVISQTAGVAQSSVTIMTLPEGPVYPAATWLRLACRHNHSEQHRLQYTWRGGCNSTGNTTLLVSDPLLDQSGWAVIWTLSTPTECLDKFLCSVYLRDEGNAISEIASELFFLQDITGVGITLPDAVFLGSLPNNSAIILDSSNRNSTQEVICRSALKSSCPGQWLDHSEAIPEDCAEGEATTDVAFNSIAFDLSSVTVEGVLVCVTEDENREAKKLFLGVYLSVPEVRVEPSFTLSHEGLVLKCTSTGAPTTTILWSRDDILLETDATALSSSFQGRSARYTSTLRLGDKDTGLFACDSYSEWMTPSRTSSGRQSASAYFVVSNSQVESEQVHIVCTFPQGVVDVQWTNASSHQVTSIPSLEQNSTAVMTLTVDENEHGRMYTCRGRVQGSREEYVYKHYTIIARVPTESLRVRIHSSLHNPQHGEPLTLKCLATHCNESENGFSLTSHAVVQWYKDGAPLDQTEYTIQSDVSEQETCLSLEFNVLTDHDNGEYTCWGHLLSPSMKKLLVVKDTILITVPESPSPTISTAEDTVEKTIENMVDNTNEQGDDSDTSDRSDRSDVEEGNSSNSSSSLTIVFIGSIGAALLAAILLLAITISIIVIYSRRKQLSAKKSESSSTLEEKPRDHDEEKLH